MVFMNSAFCSSGTTMTPTPICLRSLNSIKIQNGEFDTLYASKEITSEPTTTIPTTWDYDTILNAPFNGNLNAGNVDFVIEQISAVRIRRREVGSYNWMTLYEIPINVESDFNFELFDYFAKSNTTYEYAIVPIISGVEGNYNTNTVTSEFNGIFICEKDRAYSTDLEAYIDTVQRNQQVVNIEPIGRKYPYVIKNGLTNYDSGTVKGFFVEIDPVTCQIKTMEGFAYRKEFNDFLVNGQPKILKDYSGRMFLISVVDKPNNNINGHRNFIITSFNWVEIGDYESSTDLFNAGLIDQDYDGS
jgi:hypothetical protein